MTSQEIAAELRAANIRIDCCPASVSYDADRDQVTIRIAMPATGNSAMCQFGGYGNSSVYGGAAATRADLLGQLKARNRSTRAAIRGERTTS